MQTVKLEKKDYPLLGAKKDFSDRIKLGYTEAAKVAVYLKKEYSVKRVLLFGSLVDQEFFHAHSDIDLAVDGLPEKYYYKAVGEVMNLVENFTIDIVDLNTCKPEFRKRIIQGSVEL